MCVSKELVGRFPLPSIAYNTGFPDDDFQGLLGIYHAHDAPGSISYMYSTLMNLTPAYCQWTSNALLHVSWAMQDSPGKLDWVYIPWAIRLRDPIPLSASLNYSLTYCILLGRHVEEEVLKIQNKLYAVPSPPSRPLTLFAGDCFD